MVEKANLIKNPYFSLITGLAHPTTASPARHRKIVWGCIDDVYKGSRLQCGSPYLAYWKWPFSAGSIPRFPWSVGAENGWNRRVCLSGEGSYHSGTHNSKPRFGRGPRRQAPGRRIPRRPTGDIRSNGRGRRGPNDPGWPLPWAAGLLAWTRALFRRGDAHARCATHVWSWLHPS